MGGYAGRIGGRRRTFLKRVLRHGAVQGGRWVAVASAVAGVSIFAGLQFLGGVHPAWALSISLTVVLVLFGEGAYRVWDETDRRLITMEGQVDARRIAVALHDHADYLRLMLEEAGGREWPDFLSHCYGGARQKTLALYTRAESAGCHPDIEREVLMRPKDAEQFTAMANAFATAYPSARRGVPWT
jgi:hypothetical protein